MLDSFAVVSDSTFLGATTLESNTISLMTKTTTTSNMEITNSSTELLNTISSSANGSRQRSNRKCTCRCDEFQSYNAQLERNKMIPAEIRKNIIEEQIKQAISA
ncbi:hypothetical protein CHS0354_018610 [Potamilus streckersoni]|uniref:Uncharacterized protein n=1 Tax=Potamilus streckersoni TaxID=2493646 RepID=A0AAE0SKH8_9BIVA|nr:hypothetical protein CHS0354_018610 [Potamilus streckersoni]